MEGQASGARFQASGGGKAVTSDEQKPEEKLHYLSCPDSARMRSNHCVRPVASMPTHAGFAKLA